MQSSAEILQKPEPNLGPGVWFMELDASLQIDRVGFELPTGSIELLDRESNRLHSVQELRPGNFSSVLLLVG